ncbi:hypothetical protein F5884DRAFT_800178 [Xylogone sp. PMI_703]|nr:hypothetical protein F5884DRAFT_800178 [Xylogone sp. PMI_703]
MRPALERLLTRPSSIELLAYLLGNTSTPLPTAPAKSRRLCICQKSTSRRLYASIAIPIRRVPAKQPCGSHGIKSRFNAIRRNHSDYSGAFPENGNTDNGKQPWKDATQQVEVHRHSERELLKEDELENESDFSTNSAFRQHLVDLPKYAHDLKLWAHLLEYRQRIYGTDGARMVWDAMRKRGVQIPTDGPLASTFWETLIKAGVQSDVFLQELWEYADAIYKSSGERWHLLYVSIIQHLLLKGRGEDAIHWNRILVKNHPPKSTDFSDMCHTVALKRGDLKSLKIIYHRNKYRGVYTKIVPVLCELEDFDVAFEWHFFLTRRGDLPLGPKDVEPLILHIAVYDHEKALQITRGLISNGVPFGPMMASTLSGYNTISREVMNLIHGQTFHVRVKPYNDSLGARWFATKWVSLDLAINTIHALGVQEIGPLSLQAIALRDTDCKSVNKRIEQLKQLGISIGSSPYSRAIEEFARRGESEFLEGLLLSDQHPDTLEDWKLQETLLAHYAKNQDWTQYRRTLAVQLLGNESYDTEMQNHTLISQATRYDIPSMLETLSKMNISGVPVRAKTIGHILRSILRPRQPGRSPASDQYPTDDLGVGINVLRDILKSGGFVPITYWREIIRRLGMLGRFDELDRLCIFLVSWYAHPRDPAKKELQGNNHKNQRRTPPVQVPASHPLHPLRILFPVSLQKAMVEWGFIRRLPKHSEKSFKHPFTRGIVILRKLGKEGVDIDSAAIRSAIFNRLLILYGPGQSMRLYNRVARADNTLTLREMTKQLDRALGGPVFPGLNLRQAIEQAGQAKQRKRRKKYVRSSDSNSTLKNRG